MKQFTNLYGILAVTCESQRFVVEVTVEDNVVFPVVPKMTKTEIISVLSNTEAYNENTVKEKRKRLNLALRTMRSKLFESIETSPVILDKNFMKAELKGVRVSIVRVGTETSNDDTAIRLPKDSLITTTLHCYPEPFDPTSDADLDVVADYLASAGDCE